MKEGIDIESVSSDLLEHLIQRDWVSQVDDPLGVELEDAQAHSKQNLWSLIQEAVQDAKDRLGEEGS